MPSFRAAALSSLLLLSAGPAPIEARPTADPDTEAPRPIGRDYATGGAEEVVAAPPPRSGEDVDPAPPADEAGEAPAMAAPPTRRASPGARAAGDASDEAEAAAAAAVRSGLYRIGPEDEIQIQVIGHKEFDGRVTVSARRTVILPVVGEVDVANLTVDGLRGRLTEVYRNGYLRTPQVVVDIVEFNNMKVLVFGYVNEPGEKRLTGPTRILDLLPLVGNLKADAGTSIIVERSQTHRESGPDGKLLPVKEADTITVDLDALLHDGDLSQNIELQNGDKVYVPPIAAKVYAVGEVGKPGFYPFREGMLISDLIAMAGGLTEYANPKKVKIRRSGVPKPIPVDYKAFVKDGNLANNAPLEDGDVVIVNSSFLF